jgi:hypothetical protein
MALWRTSPRRSGGDKSAARSILRLLAAILMKAKNRNCPNYNFFYWGRPGLKKAHLVYTALWSAGSVSITCSPSSISLMVTKANVKYLMF